jgi:hypothetical protein
MRRPIIFLNELSLIVERELEPQKLLPHVLATLKTARAAKRLRSELIVVGGLAEVVFSPSFHTLRSLLRGADYREEWRSLKALEQSSPYGQDDWTLPSELEEVQFQGTCGVGLLRATENRSAVLSFALTEAWEEPYVQARHLKRDEFEAKDMLVPNLAKPEHVTVHDVLIKELGIDLSSSSIVYRADDFVLRMYFNDHDPPHFHVMAGHDSSVTLARFRIDTLDQLAQSARLRSGLRRRVIEWAESRKDALMRCWSDCKRHRHPARLE